jgi:hypothetical protein
MKDPASMIPRVSLPPSGLQETGSGGAAYIGGGTVSLSGTVLSGNTAPNGETVSGSAAFPLLPIDTFSRILSSIVPF